MKSPAILAFILLTLLHDCSLAASLPVVVRNGADYVAAADLEREAGIVIKRLPGPGQFVACGRERCAPVTSVLTGGGTTLVPVLALSEALGLTAHYDEDRRHVALVLAERKDSGAATPLRVGSLAPGFRLRKLDGTPVSLDEFRGRRVLINSWASW